MNERGKLRRHLPITTNGAICVHIPVSDENNCEEKVIRLSLESCGNKATHELSTQPTTEAKRLLTNSVCLNCVQLRNQIEFKNDVIRNLTDERESIKVKLTEIQNRNVELELKLDKYRKERKLHCRKHRKDGNTFDLQTMRERCLELEEINKHLQHHLTTLRKVFSDIQRSNSDEAINAKSKSLSDTNLSVEKIKSSESSADSSKLSSLVENRINLDFCSEKIAED